MPIGQVRDHSVALASKRWRPYGAVARIGLATNEAETWPLPRGRYSILSISERRDFRRSGKRDREQNPLAEIRLVGNHPDGWVNMRSGADGDAEIVRRVDSGTILCATLRASKGVYWPVEVHSDQGGGRGYIHGTRLIEP